MSFSLIFSAPVLVVSFLKFPPAVVEALLPVGEAVAGLGGIMVQGAVAGLGL